jgi:predicted hydrocarbon binding protein|tara:strand:- start:1861 stop:2166 length:306 start_codon:yes stop_codon:yes gene_type:complete
MDLGNKEKRIKYLEDKFDNLLDIIGQNYGLALMKELVSRLDLTIDEFNKEMSDLFTSLKNRESDRQKYLKNRNKTSKNKKKASEKKLTKWEEKLKELEQTK